MTCRAILCNFCPSHNRIRRYQIAMISRSVDQYPYWVAHSVPGSSKNSAKCQRYNLGRMRLTYGSRLGVYEVQSPLGSGGMGEVYRATLQLAGRAKQLNPNHPGWYWYADLPERGICVERQALLPGRHAPATLQASG